MAIRLIGLRKSGLGFTVTQERNLDNLQCVKEIRTYRTGIMNTIGVLSVIVIFVIIVDSTDRPSWIENLIEYIATETDCRQVIVTSNLSPNESFASRVIDQLIVKIVQSIPTILMNVVNRDDPKDFHREIEVDHHFGISDTSTSFFVHLHESQETLGFLPSERIIDLLLNMSATKSRSKFILLLISPVISDGFEDLLDYTWSKLLLDFTLVELIEIDTPGKLFDVDTSVGIPIVHRFNPFSKEYTRKNWSAGIEWFPDKVENMLRYPLKIAVSHTPPFTRAKYDDHHLPISVGGANIKLLETIGTMMNFSMEYQPKLEEFMELNENRNPAGLYKLMQSGKFDLLAYLAPHYTDSVRYNTLRTGTIRLDKLCTVVPVLPRLAMPIPTDFFEAYLVSIVIVGIFSMFKRLLRFRGKIWRPFNILRVLLGVAVSRRPSRSAERLLFACLLLVSAIYSSHIYIALTNISLQTNAEMEYRTFEDIVDSELTPIISSYVYNKTFAHADGSLLDLRNAVVVHYGSMHECVKKTIKYKNVTCLMSQEEAKVIVRRNNRKRGRRAKVSLPCFWSDSTGFLLGLGSPYRARIDGALGRIQSSGLLDTMYKDELDVSSIESAEKEAGLDVKENMKALRQQLLAIAIVGYSLSLLTFVAEILVDRGLKYKRRNSTMNSDEPLTSRLCMLKNRS